MIMYKFQPKYIVSRSFLFFCGNFCWVSMAKQLSMFTSFLGLFPSFFSFLRDSVEHTLVPWNTKFFSKSNNCCLYVGSCYWNDYFVSLFFGYLTVSLFCFCILKNKWVWCQTCCFGTKCSFVEFLLEFKFSSENEKEKQTILGNKQFFTKKLWLNLSFFFEKKVDIRVVYILCVST